MTESRNELEERLVGLGWDRDTAREAAAIEHGGHGCTNPEGDASETVSR